MEKMEKLNENDIVIIKEAELVEDYNYYDGILSGKSVIDGKYYFYHWVCCDDESNRYLLFNFDDPITEKLLNNEISMVCCIQQMSVEGKLWIHQISRKEDFMFQVKVEDMPSDYLPYDSIYFRDIDSRGRS